MADFDTPQGSVPEGPDPIPLIPETATRGASRRGLVIGGIVLGIVLVAAVGAAFAYRNLVGEPFAAAGAVPPDADIVISFDLLQVRDTDRVDRLVSAFAEPLAAVGEIDSADVDLLQEIDEEMEAELGITLTDDVIPWIGRSVSMAAWLPEDFEGDPDMLLSVAVRDRAAAAATIEVLTDQATIDSGATVERSPARGGDRWILAEDGSTTFVVWLDGDVLLVAPTMRTINRALDAREGVSLLDETAFNEVVAELPSDRLVTMYFGSEFFQSITDLTTAFVGPGVTGAEVPSLEAFGVGFTLRNDGVQFDLAQVQESASDLPLDPPTRVIESLPEDTLGYLAFVLPEGLYDEGVLDALRSEDPEGFQAMSAEAEEFLGVDVFGELIPAFGGETLLAVVEAAGGVIADQTGASLGVLGALGVGDAEPVATAIGSIEELAQGEGIDLFGENPTVVIADGSELMAYALTQEALLVGSPASVVVDYLEGSGGLTDATLYQELDAAVAGDSLTAYVNLERIFTLVRDVDAEFPDLPMRGIGAGGSNDGRVTNASLLVLIDY